MSTDKDGARRWGEQPATPKPSEGESRA